MSKVFTKRNESSFCFGKRVKISHYPSIVKVRIPEREISEPLNTLSRNYIAWIHK